MKVAAGARELAWYVKCSACGEERPYLGPLTRLNDVTRKLESTCCQAPARLVRRPAGSA